MWMLVFCAEIKEKETIESKGTKHEKINDRN